MGAFYWVVIMIMLFYAIAVTALITLAIALYYRLTKDLASNNLKRERAAINSNIDKMVNELKQRDRN